MIVVVIHWKIKPEMVGEFLEFWKPLMHMAPV